MEYLKFLCITILIGNYMIRAEEQINQFKLSSRAFNNNGEIPVVYSATERGQNISPPLQWEEAPKSTISFALTCIDIDPPMVKTITHWVLYNMPSHKNSLPEAIPHGKILGDSTIQGKNFLGENGYTGPKPPWGKHRYVFTIYALDMKITEDKILTESELEKEMRGHILAKAQLIGTYSNEKNASEE